MTPELRLQVMAAAVHTAWFAFAQAAGQSAQPWEECPEYQKGDTLHLVRFYEAFDPRDLSLDYLSGTAHVVWMKKKIRDGWTFGPVRDASAKTHPSLIPFEQLPLAEQMKDRIVVQAYLTMRKLLGEP